MKIGDRVKDIKVEVYKNSPIEIVDVSEEWNTLRYRVKYLKIYNVLGDNMIRWVDEDDIELDKEYYRDKKIETILNERV